MPVTAQAPMRPWRSRRAPEAFAPCWRVSAEVLLLAGRIHGRQFAAIEIDHARREPALARNPLAHFLWIDGHQELRSTLAGDRPAIAARMPSRMEAQTGAAGDANPVTGDYAQDHRAGGQARSVDYDPLARGAQRCEIFK